MFCWLHLVASPVMAVELDQALPSGSDVPGALNSRVTGDTVCQFIAHEVLGSPVKDLLKVLKLGSVWRHF